MPKSINLPTFTTTEQTSYILKNKIFTGGGLPYKNLVLILLVAVFHGGALLAQPEGDTASNLDYYDENIDMGDYYDDGSGSEPDKPKKEKKPYIRITLPVDTITELIAYDSVIMQETSYYDSLYIRAKRWVYTHWGVPYATKKKDLKTNEELFLEDVLYEKFKVQVQVPLKIRYNKYSSQEYGHVRFTLTMRFKDGKFKYTITNLTHMLPETSDKKDINYVYMEFYMKSDKNVVTYDRYLRAADGAVNRLLKDMFKFMREPVEIDEDDW